MNVYLVGMCGMMRTNNEGTQGYYWVEGLFKPYIKHENTVMKVVDLAYTAFVKYIICDAVFLNPVPNGTNWYTTMIKRGGFAMKWLKQVLITRLDMNRIDKKIYLSKYK